MRSATIFTLTLRQISLADLVKRENRILLTRIVDPSRDHVRPLLGFPPEHVRGHFFVAGPLRVSGFRQGVDYFLRGVEVYFSCDVSLSYVIFVCAASRCSRGYCFMDFLFEKERKQR